MFIQYQHAMNRPKYGTAQWRALQYKRAKEARRGHNYEYWGPKHEAMIENGWTVLQMEKSGRQWGKFFWSESTSSELYAKRCVDELRSAGNYARIVCGYDKNVQRIKMYTVIYKPRK